MAKKTQAKPKQHWSKSVGAYGSKVRVTELEKGGNLYLLYIDKSGKQRKRSLGHRDRKRGIEQAKELADLMAAHRVLGGQPASQPAAKPLTVAEGIEKALTVGSSGMYPVETQHVIESRRLLARAVDILGAKTTWDDLTPGRVRSLARQLATASEDGRGVRTAEYMCDMLYGVAGWLREEELISQTAAHPGKKWKVRLRQEWQAITGHTPEVQQPRHTVEDVAKIFAALDKADPRLRLLLELAAELRAGQAARARRTDLDLGSVGGFGLGRFTVRGVGKKTGEIVDLHPELRAVVDEVLTTGYLSEAEAAYQNGEIADYYLFPKYRLFRGKALVKWCVKGPLGPKSIRAMFVKLEEAAGVRHVQGRALYGLRRQGTDLAADFETDDRVLDRLTGHLDSETRKRIYQQRINNKLRARAAVTRQSMRQHLRDVAEQGEG